MRTFRSMMTGFCAAALAAGGSAWAVDFGDVMTLGDSITQGGGGGDYTSYRDELAALFAGDGDTATYVGSLFNDGASHEGHSGYVIDGTVPGIGRNGLSENLSNWMGATGANRPDHILLMIGANDIDNNRAPAGAPDRLNTLINDIRNLEPEANIYVASISPNVGSTQEGDAVRTFNRSIPTMVAQQRAAGGKVFYVDLFHTLDSGTDLSDSLHPNAQGYDRLAPAWFNAMKAGSGPAIQTNAVSRGGTAAAYRGDISSIDLVQAGAATLDALVVDGPGDGNDFFDRPGHINDGIGHDGTAAGVNGVYHPASFNPDGAFPATYTFTLDTSVNTLGYDIDTVVTYAGWHQNGSALANQAYELLVRYVSEDTFVSLGHFSFDAFLEDDPDAAGSTRLAISQTGGLLASGVDAVRFILADPGISNVTQNIDGTVYQEFDVWGSASVPEPSSIMLFAFAIAGCRRAPLAWAP